MKTKITAMFSIMLLGAAAAQADIQYNVNRNVSGATAVGFIETDGTTGTLAQSNIVNWNIVLTDGTFTWDLTGPASGNDSVLQITGSDVSASPTQLLFNFSGGDNGYLLFQTGLFSGNTYYCDQSTAGSAACLQGESIVPGSFPGPGFANLPETGAQVIGTVSSVPEPRTGLVLAGILGFVLTGRWFISRSGRIRRDSSAISAASLRL